jgi:50S ribosomal subunit-associated GTPase HflX
MRGMGEKQIDVDRRLLRSRLGVLRGRLEEVRRSTACVIEVWQVPHKRDHGQALQ